MTTFVKLLLISFLCVNSAWAENAIPVGGVPNEVSPDKTFTITNEQMEFVLDDGMVKEKYEKCKSEWGEDTMSPNIGACLWEGKLPASSSVDPASVTLDENEQKRVAQKMDQIGASGESESAKDRFESLDAGFVKKVQKEPSYQALLDHMKEKLEKTIYGENERGKLKAADHMVFHDLYKSQLGKNVIQAMSSYCLDASPGRGPDPANPIITTDKFLIPNGEDQLKKVRDRNLAILREPAATPPNGGAKILQAQTNFTECISSLQHICYNTPWKNQKDQIILDFSKYDPSTDTDYKTSQTRACNVITYIKALKQNITAIDQIKTRINELNLKSPDGPTSGGISNLAAVYVGEKNETLTNISSKEFVKESGFSDGVDQEKGAFEECMAKDESTGQMQIVDEEACKAYLDKDKEKNARIIAEADVRLRGLEKKIDERLKEEGPDGVKSYLKDQGYTEDQISELTSSDKIEDVEKEIKNRYLAERKAYIESLSKRIRDTTQEKDDFANDAADENDNFSKLERIHKELTSRSDKYTELIHFNNIVSGFLEIDNKDANTPNARNTNAMAIELGDSNYDPNKAANSGPSPASSGDGAAANAEQIKEALQDGQINPTLDEKATGNVETDQINKILKYMNEKTE